MYLVLCVPVLIIFVVLLYLLRSRNVSYWDNKGVPTGKGCHWFFGHYKDILLSKKHAGLVFDDIYNEFPEAPFVGFLKMSSPGLLVRDPELIKAVLQTDFNSFAKNDIYIDKEQDFLFGHNPFAQWGEGWKASRGHNTPHFTNAKLRNYFPVILSVADAMVKHLKSSCDERDLVELDAKELSGMFTTDSVSNVLCGIQNNCFEDKNSLFASLTREIFRSSFLENLHNMAVFLFPEFSKVIGMRLASKRAEKILLTLTRRIMRERKESNEVRSDMFQEVINQIENGKADVFTDKFIASQLYGAVLDGYVTSSITIAYTLFELAWHNDIQEKLRNEIISLIERTKGNYTIDDVDGLKYLDMVFCESLRLHVPLAVMNKRCTSDYVVTSDGNEKPVTIERGTSIAIPVHSLHRDPKWYPEPLRFDPERFSDEEVGKRNKFVYLPFGEGPRKCLGQRFGVLQSKIAVMKIIEQFEALPSTKSNYQLEVDPQVFLLRTPLNGAWIQLRKLNEKVNKLVLLT